MIRDVKGAVIDKEASYSLEREEGKTMFNSPNLSGRLNKRHSVGLGESRLVSAGMNLALTICSNGSIKCAILGVVRRKNSQRRETSQEKAEYAT